MANIEIRFKDWYVKKDYVTVEKTEETDAYDNFGNLIKLTIFLDDSGRFVSVYLDKSTAIKFAKTLRTEIAKIQE